MKLQVSDLNIRDISISGQCFRLKEICGGVFSLVAFGKILLLCGNEDTAVFSCSEKEFHSLWEDYFDLGCDYSAFRKNIPPEDKYLTDAANYGKGLRILRQDPWEMLITFIISQRKNMPAISSCVEQISEKFGDPLTLPRKKIASFLNECEKEGLIDVENRELARSLLSERTFYSFPDPASLAGAPLSELTACSLGYRDKSISKSSQSVASGELELESLKSLDTHDLFEELKKLYGVGEKVANCILLFGYHRLEAFPIDVWIARILEREYGGSFDTSPYEGYAGVIQQYMFFYETSKSQQ